MKIGMIAGEASGDIIGGAVLRALRQRHGDIECSGVGGVHMIAAGCRSLAPMETLSVMGVLEPLRRIGKLLAMRRRLIDHFLNEKPDFFIGVDAPDFNLGIEAALKRGGIPTVHCVSPSVWAWRSWRIAKIARSVDLMLTLLPFEVEFYEQHAVPARYIGHPLADALAPGDAAAARRKLQLPANGPLLGLLPGSRTAEIDRIGELFLRTAARCLRLRPELRFVVAASDAEALRRLQAMAASLGAELRTPEGAEALHWTQGRSHEVMTAVDAALIASGTATLEALLLDCPMVIAYRLDGFSALIMGMLKRSRFVGLPNLIAGRELAPEFLQKAATPAALTEAGLRLLDGDGARQRAAFSKLRQTLRCDAAAMAADALLEFRRSAQRR